MARNGECQPQSPRRGKKGPSRSLATLIVREKQLFMLARIVQDANAQLEVANREIGLLNGALLEAQEELLASNGTLRLLIELLKANDVRPDGEPTRFENPAGPLDDATG